MIRLGVKVAGSSINPDEGKFGVGGALSEGDAPE
jgi:hypothetical protein